MCRIIYQNLSLLTLFLWPQTGGWLLCRSHKPEHREKYHRTSLWDQLTAGQDKIITMNLHQQMLKMCDSNLLVFLQSHARLCSILSLNKDQLVSLDVLQDALWTHIKGNIKRPSIKNKEKTSSHTDLFIPRRHYVLHVDVTGEKSHDAIRNDGWHLQKKVAIVTNHSWKQKTEWRWYIGRFRCLQKKILTVCVYVNAAIFST